MHTEAAPEDAQVSYGRITGNVFRPDVPNLKDYLNLDGIPDEVISDIDVFRVRGKCSSQNHRWLSG